MAFNIVWLDNKYLRKIFEEKNNSMTYDKMFINFIIISLMISYSEKNDKKMKIWKQTDSLIERKKYSPYPTIIFYFYPTLQLFRLTVSIVNKQKLKWYKSIWYR